MPVERGLGGDADGVLGEAERLVGDADLKMLGHVALSEHRADRLANRRGAAQRTARPLHAGRNARQLLLGGSQQFGAFAGASAIDDYQEALKVRVSASHGRVFLIEGNETSCAVPVPGLDSGKD